MTDGKTDLDEESFDELGAPLSSESDTRLVDALRVVWTRRREQPDEPEGEDERLDGQRIGPYLVEELLGQGGMSQVYRATDLDAGMTVALKVLRPRYRADMGLVARLQREAESLQQIQHANVIRVFGCYVEEGILAVAMERLTGGSLRDRIDRANRRGSLMPLDEALSYARQCASGLGAAHAHGIIHRDVKPGNFLLDIDDTIKVADFGIVAVLDQATWLRPGQRIGTPGYMSPEQCRGKAITPASDVYGLGVTFYELFVGRRPFADDLDSPFSISLQHVSEPVPDPRTVRPDLPAGITALILRCLEKEPLNRYATAGLVAEALESQTQEVGEHRSRAIEAGPNLINVEAIRGQLQHLPQRAIVAWAVRCGRRVQMLNKDPRLEQLLTRAENVAFTSSGGADDSLSSAVSRIRKMRADALEAAYSLNEDTQTEMAVQAARAAAAAAACAAARSIEDAGADAAYAARCAVQALQAARRSARAFWRAARDDYQKLLAANLGTAGSLGRPVPRDLFD